MERLLTFILQAHRHTYAAPRAIREQHRSARPRLQDHKEYTYTEGEFSYHDSYAGDLWAPGREVVFHRGRAIWCMAYQGQTHEAYDDCFFQKKVFPFLRKALLNANEQLPFRGPEKFLEGEFTYTFKIEGDARYFRGREEIIYKGERVFFQDVMGSMIR